MSKPQFEYYQILGIQKTASQQQIKQSYKKLALKFHPDKNVDKQMAKVKFREITQAYTVLNNPQKRQIYDKYGMVDDQLNNFSEFQEFMNDYGFFEEMLQQFLMFDSMNQLNKMFNKMNGKGKNKKRKGGKRTKISSNGFGIPNMKKSQMQQLQKMFAMMGTGAFGGDMQDLGLQDQFDDPALFQAMMKQMGMGGMFAGMNLNINGNANKSKKSSSKSNKKQQDQEQIEDCSQQDDQQLSQLQIKTLQFGQQNVQKKKIKRKNVYKCIIDGQKMKKDQILMHFTQKHLDQVKKWIQLGCKKIQQSKQEKQTKVQKQ